MACTSSIRKAADSGMRGEEGFGKVAPVAGSDLEGNYIRYRNSNYLIPLYP